MGNHELYFIEKKINTKNNLVKDFFNHSFKKFNGFKKIKKYKKKIIEKNIHYIHTLKNQYIYKDTEIEFTNNLFVGHSHKQFLKSEIKKNFY